MWPTAEDACSRATISEISGHPNASAIVSFVGGVPTFGTTNGGAVGESTLTFAWTPSQGGVAQETLTWVQTINPVCAYSPIYFTTSFLPIVVDIGATIPIFVPTTDVYHQY